MHTHTHLANAIKNSIPLTPTKALSKTHSSVGMCFAVGRPNCLLSSNGELHDTCALSTRALDKGQLARIYCKLITLFFCIAPVTVFMRSFIFFSLFQAISFFCLFVISWYFLCIKKNLPCTSSYSWYCFH